MLSGPTPPASHSGLSKHRIEALTDGVYAIAITLLVLDLRLPHDLIVTEQDDLVRALIILLPNFLAWVVSFFVLAIFWFGHHRTYQWVRTADGTLIWISILSLGPAGFFPFATSLIGHYPEVFAAQLVYAVTMGLMGLMSAWNLSYLARHPELCFEPMSRGHIIAGRVRSFGVMATALLAVLIALWDPRFGTTAFMLMFFISRIGRAVESRYAKADADRRTAG